MNHSWKHLKVLADPTRVRLLLLLEVEELSVAELQEILGMGQSRISSQLAQLKSAGLTMDRRVGKNTFYSLVTPATKDQVWISRLMELVHESARGWTEAQTDHAALKLIRDKRNDRMRAYFDELAGRFGKEYCPGRSWQGVAEMFLRLLPPLVVADLGAGEGTLSQMIAQKAKKVIAIDLSQKMVDYGTELAKKHGVENLEYRLGDMEDPPIETESVDLVILSQALHHARQPLKVLHAAAKILKPEGRIMILDLLKHQVEEAREWYSDYWLGFSQVELLEDLTKAGFSNLECTVVHREEQPPHFQTVLATGIKPH